MTFPFYLWKGETYWRFSELDHIWYENIATKAARYVAEDVFGREELTTKHRGPPLFNVGEWMFFKLPGRAHPYSLIAIHLKMNKLV